MSCNCEGTYPMLADENKTCYTFGQVMVASAVGITMGMIVWYRLDKKEKQKKQK
jgi:hypothetical protein